MPVEIYKGYVLRGFAWAIGAGYFVASGGVDKDSRRVSESEDIACYPTLEEAAVRGLAWARDWVDLFG